MQFFRAVGQWTTSLYEYFEREQARLDGELSVSQMGRPKQDVLRNTFTAARDKARKLSASVGGGPVASSYNLWNTGGVSSNNNNNVNSRQLRQLRRIDAGIGFG